MKPYEFFNLHISFKLYGILNISSAHEYCIHTYVCSKLLHEDACLDIMHMYKNLLCYVYEEILRTTLTLLI